MPFSAMLLFFKKAYFYFVCFTATSNCPTLECEYKCQASLNGGACYCPEGKKIDTNNKSCIGKCIFCYTKNDILLDISLFFVK